MSTSEGILDEGQFADMNCDKKIGDLGKTRTPRRSSMASSALHAVPPKSKVAENLGPREEERRTTPTSTSHRSIRNAPSPKKDPVATTEDNMVATGPRSQTSPISSRGTWSMHDWRHSGLELSLTPASGCSQTTKETSTVDMNQSNFDDRLDVNVEGDKEDSETSELYRHQQQQQQQQRQQPQRQAAHGGNKQAQFQRFYQHPENRKRVYKPIPKTQQNWKRPTHTEVDEDDVNHPKTKLNDSFGTRNTCPQRLWNGRLRRQNSGESFVSGLSVDEEENQNPPVDLPFDSTAMGKSFRISHKKKDEADPNNHHPSLECPPLYFFLKMIPGNWLTRIRSLYALRWSLCYKLQRRIWLTKSLRKVGIFLTWGELFLLLPFFATVIAGLVYTYIYPDVSISGHLARTPLIFAFLTAQRNSFLSALLGIPVERAIWYHKLTARVAYFNGLLHTYVAFLHPDKLSDGATPIHSIAGSHTNFGLFLFQDVVNSGGTMLILFMSGMILTALPWVRRKAFEVFYFLHVIFATCMVICAFYHTGIIVPIIAGIVWGGDLFIRKVLMAACRYPRKATLTIISDSVVEIAFPKTKGFDYNPGQYIYIAVPELSWLQWHPFSLSSSPEQKVVTLHIRKAGSWTQSLYALATESAQREVEILFEGPYGSVGVDLMSPRYKMMMLISGGIGVTPMQSMCNQLMYEHSTNQRILKHLSFIWVERDPVVMQEVDVVRRTSTKLIRSSADFMPLDECASAVSATLVEAPPQGIASTLLAMVPASSATDAEFDAQYPLEDLDDDSDVEYDDSQSMFNRPQSDDNRHAFVSASHRADLVKEDGDVVAREEDSKSSKGSGQTESTTGTNRGDDDDEESFIQKAYNFPEGGDIEEESERSSQEFGALDLQVYLTAKNKTNPGISELPFVHTGRPDIKALFRKMKEEAIAKGERRVAVCVCAPLRLVVIARKACAKYSDRQVRFDFHEEVFE
eukprot:CAMPEP_0194044016 /NCGR_PEP_ID=MMETSP0009_2-20130614/15563_1 /TAXON_ID=210454 /ORGANISM="Grammatophora oceanica, Strain CCMP 410" /LENGTH=969 /DNA_ID=CAMNT_0038688429 /DNA_START=590 /DNA_END=3499 /DNA_ORIENTATION=+